MPTYCRGVRLGCNALRAAKPILGLLIIEDRHPENEKAPVVRIARFRHADAVRFPEVLLPLFDPVLLRCDQRGVLLGGFEGEAQPGGEGGRMLQAWWLRPVPEDSAAHFKPGVRPAR